MWKSQYGFKRIRELEVVNGLLKQPYADFALESKAMKDLSAINS